MLDKMTDRLIRLKDVVEITSLSKSEIYRRVAAGNFPKQERKSHKVSVWKLSEVEQWVRGEYEGAQ